MSPRSYACIYFKGGGREGEKGKIFLNNLTSPTHRGPQTSRVPACKKCPEGFCHLPTD